MVARYPVTAAITEAELQLFPKKRRAAVVSKNDLLIGHLNIPAQGSQGLNEVSFSDLLHFKSRVSPS